MLKPRCVNADCRTEVDPGWLFCPVCGADNRPPEVREAVYACDHVFPLPGGCCVLCGRLPGTAVRGDPWLAIAFAAVGLPLVAFAATLFVATDSTAAWPSFARSVCRFVVRDGGEWTKTDFWLFGGLAGLIGAFCLWITWKYLTDYGPVSTKPSWRAPWQPGPYDDSGWYDSSD